MTLPTAMLAGVLVTASVGASAQTNESAALAAEVAALRKSVDQLVEIVRLYAQQSLQRDAAAVLSRRIDTDERRLTQLTQQLETVRAKRAAEEAEVAKLRSSVEVYTQMAAGDPTGAAQAAMEQERVRTTAVVAQKTALIAQLDDQIARLESDAADKKKGLEELGRRLDQQLESRPKP